MNDLTKGPVGKQLFYFAMPMLAANVFQQLYSIADSIVVGKFLGKAALAAVGASFPVIYVLISMVIGIGSGASVLISQYYGAKKPEKVKLSISTNFIFLFYSGIAVSLTGIFVSDYVFRLIGLPEDVWPKASEYFKIYSAGQLFFFMFNGIASVLRGLGDSKTPFRFSVISTLLNIGLDLLFVLYFHWGIEGVAWATVVSQAVVCIWAAVYLQHSHPIISFRLKELKFDRAIFRQSMKLGIPTGFQQSFVAFGMMAMVGIVSTFGTDVIAAYTVVSRIDAIASMPAMIFGSALSAFVGQNVGAGKYDRVNTGLWRTILLSGSVAIMVSLVVIVFDKLMIQMFTTDPAVIAIGREYLTIVCSFYLLFSSMFAFHGLFRGAGESIVPMLVSLLSLWIIRIPFAWLMSKPFGVVGIWWATPLAWFTGLLLSVLYYRFGKWREKSVVKEPVTVVPSSCEEMLSE